MKQAIMDLLDGLANSSVSLDMGLVFQIGGQETNNTTTKDNTQVSSSDKTIIKNTSPKAGNTSNNIDLLA